MYKSRGGVCVALAGLIAMTARAQVQPAPLEPMPSPATQAPAELSSPATNDVDELGQLVLLQSPPRPKVFRATSDTEYLYTSNRLLLPNTGLFPAKSDALLFQTFDFSLSPRIVNRLTSTIFIRQQLARYYRDDQLNFDAQAAGLQLAYPVQNWFTVYGGFSASRMYFDEGNKEFFKMYDTQFGLYRSDALCSRASVFYGYQIDWQPSTPSILSRVNNSLYAGLDVTLMQKLTGQVLYRLSFQDYQKPTEGATSTTFVDRSDLNNMVSAGLTYMFNDYLNVRAYFDYVHNGSNVGARDYAVVDGGGGLTVSIQF